jgi:hypothetical protein
MKQKMFSAMEKLGMDYSQRRTTYQLYKAQVATICMKEGRNTEAKISKGV